VLRSWLLSLMHNLHVNQLRDWRHDDGLGVAGGRYWGESADPHVPAAMAASPPFVREAVLAHAVFVPEKRHPVEVAASDEAHLVQWLSRRLGAPLKVPSLAKQGYQLLGGRLLPGDGTPRAQFMYENAQGSRVTLYVAVFEKGQAPDSVSFRSVRVGGEESFYWVEDRFGYALSANVNGTDMQALAREVWGQLER
jgi:anti-sigma factor RsiW